jgi:mono/diheme cytochrome c family protein
VKEGSIIIPLLCFAILWTFLPGESAHAAGDPKAGQAKYRQICGFCHGIYGKGDGPAAKGFPVKPSDHTNQERMSKLSDSEMEKIIEEGGRSAGRSPLMPPFGNKLSPEDVQDLIAFIRSLAK